MIRLFRLLAVLIPALAVAVPAIPGHGVAAIGEFTPPTRSDALHADYQRELISRVQRALKDFGYYDGPVTGALDAATEAAVRTYQRQAGLPETGRVTESLVDHLEHAGDVQTLLRRLERARETTTDAARKALESHPATRDLLENRKADEPADPTRDPAPCFRDPTVRCLLDEAIESVKAVGRADLRDWALGEILIAQARAGLADEAMDTVRRISDPRLIIVALRDIAEALALSRRADDAIATADIIPQADKRAEAYARIGDILANAGAAAGAAATVDRLAGMIEVFDTPVKKALYLSRGASVLGRIGRNDEAAAMLKRAEDAARGAPPDARDGALRHVASAHAALDRLDDALRVLADVKNDSERAPIKMAVAEVRARSGDAAGAIESAKAIGEARYRALVLATIAADQAAGGDAKGARSTVDEALAATDVVRLPYARAYAASRVALVMAGIGADAPELFDRARRTARRIENTRLRADTLWRIAAVERRAGLADRMAETETLAQKATAGIESSVSQIWLYSELAEHYALAGDADAAWSMFRRGLDVAEGVTNAWGRGRVLGRLSSTLIRLVESAPQGHAGP